MIDQRENFSRNSKLKLSPELSLELLNNVTTLINLLKQSATSSNTDVRLELVLRDLEEIKECYEEDRDEYC